MFLFFRSFLILSLMFIFFSCGGSDDKSSSTSSNPRSKDRRANVDDNEAGDTRCKPGLVWDEDLAVKERENLAENADADADADAGEGKPAELDTFRVCRSPKTGYFVNGLGEEEACTPVENITAPTFPTLDESGIPDTFNDGDFLPNAGPLAEDACPFKCREGYARDTIGRVCSIPPKGMYADRDDEARLCNKIVDGDGTKDDGSPFYAPFEDNTDPVSDANGCPFTCERGTRPDAMEVEVEVEGELVKELLHPRVCNAEGVGTYEDPDEGTEQCTPFKYISRWLPPVSPPLTTDTCDYECQLGYLKGGVATNRKCTTPPSGSGLMIKESEGGLARLFSMGPLNPIMK